MEVRSPLRGGPRLTFHQFTCQYTTFLLPGWGELLLEAEPRTRFVALLFPMAVRRAAPLLSSAPCRH